MNFDPKDKKNLPVVKFLESKNYLIADNTTMGRSTIRKMLSNLGVDGQTIFMTDNFADACSKIETEKTHFVFATYDLGDNKGIELLKVHKEAFSNRLDTGFFIISENNSLALAAEMADSDVDGYISKPYTLGMLIDLFLKVALPKALPTEYLVKLEEGKELLAKEQFQEALEILTKAKNLDKAPALACYFVGSTFRKLKQVLKAQEVLEEGLTYGPTNYKCLNELLEVYMELNNFKDAYKIASTLSQNYPLNPKKIPDFTRLSILSGHYEDILNYSKIFSGTDEVLEDSIRYHVGAGLAICGKYFIRENKIDKAIQALQTAAALCKDRVPILVNVISTLISINKKDLADEIFTKMAQENPNPEDPTIKLLELEVKDQAMSATDSLKLALELKTQGMKEFKVYDVLIQRSIELKRRSDLIEDLIKEAKDLFPEKKEYFNQLLIKFQAVKQNQSQT